MAAHRTALALARETPSSSVGSTRLPAEPEHSVGRCAVERAALLPELPQPWVGASSSPAREVRVYYYSIACARCVEGSRKDPRRAAGRRPGTAST